MLVYIKTGIEKNMEITMLVTHRNVLTMQVCLEVQLTLP